jgi:hypothetical protein
MEDIMTRITKLRTLLGAAALVAVALGNATPASALLHGNAITTNAITTNAMTANALSSNALSPNALAENGVRLSGASLEGVFESVTVTTVQTPSGDPTAHPTFYADPPDPD